MPDPDVDPGLLDRLRSVCLGFPEVVEEQAWIGTRWRVRGKTFAHVLVVEDAHPPVYATAIGAAAGDDPRPVLAFRSSGRELRALRAGGPPFHGPPWRGDEVLLDIDDDTDWDEVAELLTESYCLQAPKKLAALVDRPEEADGA